MWRFRGQKQKQRPQVQVSEVGHKGTGDVEGLVQDKGSRGPIPRSEGGGGMSHAQTTVGEGGSISFTLEEPLSRKASLESEPVKESSTQ